MWSHDVVSSSIGLASDLKMGQYLKIPPRVMFLTQVWGTIIGTSSILNVPYCQLISSGAVVNYGMHLVSPLPKHCYLNLACDDMVTLRF